MKEQVGDLAASMRIAAEQVMDGRTGVLRAVGGEAIIEKAEFKRYSADK